MWKVSYVDTIYGCCWLVILDDLKVGGNNEILEISTRNKETYPTLTCSNLHSAQVVTKSIVNAIL